MASEPDLSSLRGKRVLITGAARGIGAALAEKLGAHGARLALVGLEPRRWPRSPSAAARARSWPSAMCPNREQVTQAVDAAAEALGGLDVVVANAGIATGGPLRSQDVRAWERVIEINLLGVMYTDRAALPHLERSRGYVLNIASTAAVLRGPGMSAYCAAKAGRRGAHRLPADGARTPSAWTSAWPTSCSSTPTWSATREREMPRLERTQ